MTYAPYEIIGEHRDSRWLVTCDHAANTVPDFVAGGDLGLPPEDMARHIAYDPGAAGLSRYLAEILGAPAIMSNFSRLVIDPNRGEDDPTLVMRLSDGSIIAGNRHVSEAEIARRISAYHRPYHQAIDAALDRVIAAGHAPVIVSMHSFTPQFHGRPVRPWQIALLWDRDDRLEVPLLARLRAEGDLCVGDNEPYVGSLAGDCMWQHGTQRGIAHILIEIRNDLISTPEDQVAWVDRLAPVLRASIADMHLAMAA